MTEIVKRARILSRNRLILVLALVLVPAILYVSRTSLLAGVGNFLVVKDKLEPADVIFLLNGDATSRPYHAAKLFHQGLAPKVMIARMEDSQSVLLGAYPNPTDSNITVLRQLGLKESDIVQLRPEKGVMHTADEAKALVDYVKDHPVHTVTIVTSDIHSRRSRYTFRRALKGLNVQILMAPVPDLKYGADNWWHSEDGIIGCQNEYIKLLYYFYKY